MQCRFVRPGLRVTLVCVCLVLQFHRSLLSSAFVVISRVVCILAHIHPQALSGTFLKADLALLKAPLSDQPACPLQRLMVPAAVLLISSFSSLLMQRHRNLFHLLPQPPRVKDGVWRVLLAVTGLIRVQLHRKALVADMTVT